MIPSFRQPTQYRAYRRLAGAFIVCIAALALTTPLRAEVTEVGEPALESLIAEGATIIDVRREDEWRETGILPGSHTLTFFDARGRYDVDAWLNDLSAIADKHETLVLVCAHGVRSSRIAELLDRRLGFSDVHNVTDGIEAWRKGGGDTVPYLP